MLAEATNENSKIVGHVEVKTPTITDVYITYGEIEEIKSKKEGESSKKKITLGEKCDKGLFGRSYFIVVETKDFPTESNCNFKISFRSKRKVLSDADSAIKIMVDDLETELIEVSHNNFFNDKEISNNSDFGNKAVKEFCFNRKLEEDHNAYKKLISESANNNAIIYLKIDDITNSPIGIECNGHSKSEDKKCFYFEENYLLIDTCFCNKNITAIELKNMITALNGGKEKNLFNWPNCKIDKGDRTYERLAEELNFTFEKYSINTCNRKAHFIAQAYIESGSFGTVIEGGEGKQYELKNWENRQKELEENIKKSITLKSEVDKIIEKHKGAIIDESKNQITEVDTKVLSISTLTEDEKTIIISYKKNFEEKWKPQLDQKATCIYNKKQEYENALAKAKTQIENIKNNGNTHDGDGSRYKGKGLIQLTWRKTYENYFSYVKTKNPIPESVKNKTIDEVLNRKDNDMSQLLGSDLFYAVDSAGWFWSVYKQSKPYYLADAADYDGNTVVTWNRKKMLNIEKITRIINGGINHLKERKECYNEIRDNIFKIKSTCVNFEKIK